MCLFDLRDQCDYTVQNTRKKYDFLGTSWFKSHTPDFSEWNLAYLFLDSDAWSRLVPNDFARKECPYGHYVPDTEVWFPGDIPLDLIEEALLVRIRNKAPKHDHFLYAHHMRAVQEEKSRKDR